MSRSCVGLCHGWFCQIQAHVFLAVSLFAPVTGVTQASMALELPRESGQLRSIAIDPSTTGTVTTSIPIDGGIGLSFFIVSPVPIDVAIISPDLGRIDAANAASFSITFDRADQPTLQRYETIIGYGPVLATGGAYDVEATLTTPPSQAALIEIMAFSESSVRVSVGVPGRAARVGSDFAVSAFVLEDTTPILGATVVALINVNGTVTPVLLVDGGGPGDENANDGIYSAVHQIATAGRYPIAVQATGNRSDGNAFVRHASVDVRVIGADATFTGSFTHALVDDDGDSLTDRIDVTAGLTVNTPSEYLFLVEAEASNGESVPARGSVVVSQAGAAQVTAGFSADSLRLLNVDGPYTITRADLYQVIPGVGSPLEDWADGVLTTVPHLLNALEREEVIVDDSGITLTDQDVDLDGKIDSILIDVPVTVQFTGDYRLSVYVRDSTPDYVAQRGDIFSLATGQTNVSTYVNGCDITDHPPDPPLELGMITVAPDPVLGIPSFEVDTSIPITSDFASLCDNCPFHPNPAQRDCDSDGVGDRCDVEGCPGDCDCSGIVDISELITAVAILLDQEEVTECLQADLDNNGSLQIFELVSAVRSLLAGCGAASPAGGGAATSGSSPNVTINIGTGGGILGSDVQVPIDVVGTAGQAVGFQIDLLFDPTVVSVATPSAACVAGSAITQNQHAVTTSLPSVPPPPPGKQRLRVAVLPSDLGAPVPDALVDGNAAVCTFSIVSQVANVTTPIDGDNHAGSDGDGGPLGTTATPGSITVCPGCACE